MGSNPNTVYLDDYHEVVFQLRDGLSKSGTAREAFDGWLEQEGISTSELKMATTIVSEKSSKPLDDFVNECATVEEFIERAEALTEE